jgi:hypothetical protein
MVIIDQNARSVARKCPWSSWTNPIEELSMVVNNGDMTGSEYAVQSRRQDRNAVAAVLAHIAQLEQAAKKIRLNEASLYDAISGVQTAIARAMAASDPSTTALALSAAVSELQDKVTAIITILDRDMSAPLERATSVTRNARSHSGNRKTANEAIDPLPPHDGNSRSVLCAPSTFTAVVSGHFELPLRATEIRQLTKATGC